MILKCAITIKWLIFVPTFVSRNASNPYNYYPQPEQPAMGRVG